MLAVLRAALLAFLLIGVLASHAPALAERGESREEREREEREREARKEPDSLRVVHGAGAAIGRVSASWPAFANRLYRYRLRYPPEAVADTADPSGVVFRFPRSIAVPGESDPVTCEYLFRIVASPNPRRLGPDRWVEYLDSLGRHDAVRHPIFDPANRRRRGSVHGHGALRIRVREGDQEVDYIYVSVDAVAFELSCTAGAAGTPDDFRPFPDVFRAMLRSFTPDRRRR